jgi:hypothetical protein
LEVSALPKKTETYQQLTDWVKKMDRAWRAGDEVDRRFAHR